MFVCVYKTVRLLILHIGKMLLFVAATSQACMLCRFIHMTVCVHVHIHAAYVHTYICACDYVYIYIYDYIHICEM